MKNCSDWEQEIAGELDSAELAEHLGGCEHCHEFAQELEKNSVALRELTVDPAAFGAVRRRVIGEIQAKRRRAMWWTWSAVAASACIAMLCVSYILPRFDRPAAPAALVARKDPPKIEWTLPPPDGGRVHHKSSGRSVARATPVRKTESLVVKMLTNDPNVIIIWLVDQKGDSL